MFFIYNDLTDEIIEITDNIIKNAKERAEKRKKEQAKEEPVFYSKEIYNRLAGQERGE